MKKQNEEGGKNSSSSVKEITREEFIAGVINDVKTSEEKVRQGAKS